MMEDTASRRVLEKMVYAGTSLTSYAEATQALAHLGNLSVSEERVRRACLQAGGDRMAHHEQLQATYENKPLPEQVHGKPAEVEPPEIACVMGDGGRYQHLERDGRGPRPRSARQGDHWKESRIGLLVSMSGPAYEGDPQPTLPPEYRYEAMAETLSQIGKTGAKPDSPEPSLDEPPPAAAAAEAVEGPTVEQRYVVASRQSWEEFGPLLASQAWYRGFAAARRKVFISDGSATIEKLQRTHFSHYISVLDILHALAYALAAARAVCDQQASARQKYDQWAAWIWEGRVAEVIEELIGHGIRLGEPPPEAHSDDPREVVRKARVYYQNHAARMDYPSYRRQGFPLTSSLMESTVKQVSRRVKATEKFWSAAGSEAMLRLRGEYLSDDRPMPSYWRRRSQLATGTRAYRKRRRAVYT